METHQILRLINEPVIPGPVVWADLGSGDGAFTLALRELAGPEVEIYSVDKSGRKLKNQKKAFDEQFPNSNITFIQSDFTKDLELPPLDGILMANSLHFVKDKISFLEKIKKHLKPSGSLLIVEYDTDNGNFFVPYPLTFKALSELLVANGFSSPKLLETVPSRYQGQMYSAQASLPIKIA